MTPACGLIDKAGSATAERIRELVRIVRGEGTPSRTKVASPHDAVDAAAPPEAAAAPCIAASVAAIAAVATGT